MCLRKCYFLTPRRMGFSPVFSPLVPGIIRFIFYTLFTEELEHVFHCSLAIWVCLGRRHKEPVKGLHLQREYKRKKEPRQSTAAKRSVSDCSLFGPIFTEFRFCDSQRKHSSHGPVKNFLPYFSRPHAPRPTLKRE